jgi:hypothetical protein
MTSPPSKEFQTPISLSRPIWPLVARVDAGNRLKGKTLDPYRWVISYGASMKTTVEIADKLLKAAKSTAAARGTTLRDLIERGLRHEIDADRVTPFALTDASFAGSGTHQGVDEGDWSTIREMIYKGRGG